MHVLDNISSLDFLTKTCLDHLTYAKEIKKYFNTHILNILAGISWRREESENGVSGLFQSYFSWNVEKLPSLSEIGNRLCWLFRDAWGGKTDGASSLLADESRHRLLSSGWVRDGSSLFDKRLTIDGIVHKLQPRESRRRRNELIRVDKDLSRAKRTTRSRP